MKQSEKITSKKSNPELQKSLSEKEALFQKVERKLEIEASLTRVRALTMVMKRSEEISEIIIAVHRELRQLDMALTRTLIWLFTENPNTYEVRLVDAEADKVSFRMREKVEHAYHKRMFQKWKERKSMWVYINEGDDKKDLDDYLFTKTAAEAVPEEVKTAIRSVNRIVNSFSFHNFGCLQADGDEKLSKENFEILFRFAKEFDLAYTRFLDLQKAEAQAKEAEIQLALERIRARTMAMQKSDELPDVALTFLTQVDELAIPVLGVALTIVKNEDDTFVTSLADNTKDAAQPELLSSGILKKNVVWLSEETIDRMRGGEKEFTMEAKGHRVKAWVDFIGANFSRERAKRLRSANLEKIYAHAVEFYRSSNFIFSSIAPLLEEHKTVIRRLIETFRMSYLRFLDLQKAEAQAREAEIQLALERVRAGTMAMQNSDELSDASFLMANQIRELGIKAWGCAFHIYADNEEGDYEWFSSEDGYLPFYKTPREKVFQRYYEKRKSGESLYIKEFKGEACKLHYDYLLTLPIVGQALKDLRDSGIPLPTSQIDHVVYFSYGYLLFITYEPVPEAYNTFKRFAKEFEQTYTRFLDLQKAETQVREAQIEAALERVRSVSMAMHKSYELVKVATTVYQQLIGLGFDSVVSGGFNFPDAQNKVTHCWFAETTNESLLQNFRIPYAGDKVLDERHEYREKGIPFLEQVLKREEVKKHMEFVFPNDDSSDEELAAREAMPDPTIFSIQFLNEGYMILISVTPLSEDQKSIMGRFANVFNSAYTRFLDLQKAEEQARESQIQLALERVRARTMAMQKSEELNEVIAVMYEQLDVFDISKIGCELILCDEEKDQLQFWSSSILQSRLPERYDIPRFIHPFFKKIWNTWKRKQPRLTITLDGKEKRDFDKLIFSKTDFKKFPDKVKKYIRSRKSDLFTFAIMKYGVLEAVDDDALSEDSIKILERFAEVFEQTYTRFLDLQKAEAQAREAQVEAALERVRAKAMAMHSTKDISEATAIVFNELTGLGFEMERCGIAIFHKESSQLEIWSTPMSPKDKKVKEIITGFLNADFHPMIQHLFDSWIKKEGYSSYTLKGKEVRDYYKKLGDVPGYRFPKISDYPNRQTAHCFFFEYGNIFVYSKNELSEGQKQLLHRFTNVFSLTYKRYLDLQKAEAQAREAQIEAALERVRAQAMAMHNSEDLNKTIRTFYEQFDGLTTTPIIRCGSGLVNKKERTAELTSVSRSDDNNLKNVVGTIDMTGHPLLQAVFEHWLKQKEYHHILRGREIKKYYQSISGQVDIPDYPDDVEQHAYFPFFAEGSFYCFTKTELPTSELDVLRKFSSVLSLTYRRFNDLQKAEAQAREAQIEASLERVRAKAMAMHGSQDISEATAVVFNEITRLGIELDRCGIVILNERSTLAEVWSTPLSDKNRLVTNVVTGHLDCNIHPMLRQVYKAWENKDLYFNYHLAGQDLLDYYQKLEKIPGYRFPKTKIYPERQAVDCYFFDQGYIFAYSRKDPLNKEKEIFHRFTKVFSLTYRRYIDLKNAERQAREAQIETALERLRSATMAMHNSNDVSSAIVTLFDQVSKLGLDKDIRCGIGILKGSERMETWSVTSYPGGEVDLKTGLLDMTIHPMLKRIKKAWENGVSHYTDQMSGKSMVKYYTALNNEPDYSFQRNLNTLPKKEYHNSFSFEEGILFSFSPNRMPEETAMVLKRFAYVFGQTYRRYIDLLKAEAQAREAYIEAALERVRAQTMAMQHSNDLVKSTTILFEELGKLELSVVRSGIGIFDEETRDCQLWTMVVKPDGKTELATGITSLTVHPLLMETFSSWKIQKPLQYILKGKELSDYYQLVSNSKFQLPNEVIKSTHSLQKEYYLYTPFGAGGLYVFSESELSDNEKKILRRFAEVFHLAYTRFEDLQKAEERAKESVKQASLDRVRAEIASMRSTKDLERITPLIWKELSNLGVPFFRCGIFILNEETQKVHAYLSTPGGESLAALHLGFDETDFGLIGPAVEYWRKQEPYREMWKKERFLENVSLFMKRGHIKSPEKYQAGEKPPERLVLQLVPFKQGMLYAGNSETLIPEHVELMQELADAFSVAYSRYEDFTQLEQAKDQIEKALGELKSTQTQLIHSEKMASLGELTAGIAHEIQNPLNFVNNFSEVSRELIEELKEEREKPKEDRDENLEEEILDDVIENLEKINHHGQRASSIVKGMLEHSRKGRQEKELTDLNTLADEYLRLAYHGLRAKDKSFNADFKVNLYENLPKVKLIAQDIGRVLLNLINNAFYACVERSLHDTDDYKPEVIVQTKLNNKSVEIIIRDNGKGIPASVVDKIFQPFFTTKPTGQGTGLGLSLSYDIITKGHDGHLEVETEEGIGTQFIVRLPII